MTDVRELARDMMDELALVNEDNRRWREPPLGIASFLDWYQETGKLPEDVDVDDLRWHMENYL